MKYSMYGLPVLTLFLALAAGMSLSAEDRNVPPSLPQTSELSGATPATGEQIKWQVISSGGARATSTSFTLNGTVGQTTTGEGGSTSFGLTHGYWQSHGCCVGISGNADGDPTETCDISDLTKIIDYLFITNTPPDCMAEANTDGSLDCICDISDLTKVIDYLFITYTPPAPCL
jgi:hypothetical protein